MKKGLTHIIFVVDRSGSMASIASDMIGGYNDFIKKQKKEKGACYVSFYQFDDIYEQVFVRTVLKNVKELDSNTYSPRNSTALYDAIGKTISDYSTYLASLTEKQRPERILFVTITDGLNNASREYNLQKVRDLIQDKTTKAKWDFVFLGSNIDAWDAGQSMGVSSSSTLQFANVKGSVKKAFSSLNKNTCMYRSSAMKSNYSFDAKDYKDQDEFLDGNLKSKNKQQQNKSKTKTK